MKILGIETSCDETAAAIVEDGVKILSNVTATSAGIHARTGGVIPEEAARKQIKAVIPIIDLSLKDASLKPRDLDAVAVTVGPGLIGSLLVGVETSKTLSYIWNKPIIPVNHLVGHIYANWLEKIRTPEFPALALVVSGGHTDLVLMKGHGKIEWLGGTRDDAAGEAFDKTARLLGFSYPGGPALSNAADEFIYRNKNFKLTMFPRPIINEKNFDWSFSGLKTAVLYKVGYLLSENYNSKKFSKLSDYQKTSTHPKMKKLSSRIAAEVQEAIVDSLVTKTLRAVRIFKPKTLLLAGGVAANRRLREKFLLEENAYKLSGIFHVPSVSLCTDNAAYISSCAFFNFKPISWKKVVANPGLTITPYI